MLFVPLLKNRPMELRAAKYACDCFSENMIPLFEVIHDVEVNVYDPITGEKVYKELPPGSNNRRSAKKVADRSHIATLNSICNAVQGHLAFIDFFRFKEETYGKSSFNPSAVSLSIELSRDTSLYKSALSTLSAFPNLIPVVSIKTGFSMNVQDLYDLLGQLQICSPSVALRITEEFLDPYKVVIENQLRKTDYLLYDIGEQPAISKAIELFELQQCHCLCKKILLNSPRPRKKNNADYAPNGKTFIIDNSALHLFSLYGLDGIGDYCGLKDTLPAGGGSGQGMALALMFDFHDNAFWSYINPNKYLGARGFGLVKQDILADSVKLDPYDSCLAFKRIHSLPGSGSWSSWVEIIVLRYIHQLYLFQHL